MAYNGVDLVTEPAYLSDGSYTAQNDRSWFDDIMRDGIIGTGDYLVSAGTGFTLSVAAGTALVQGQNVTDQGMYRAKDVIHSNAFTITTADLTKPRIDQLILRIWDASHDTSGARKGRIELVPGTATTGATLNNRTGAADLTALTDNSKSVLLLADVLVPAGVTTSAGCTIRDRRKLTWPKNCSYNLNYNQVGTVGSGNPGGSTSEVDLIPSFTLPGYLLRSADYLSGAIITAEIDLYGFVQNTSGSGRTSVYRVYQSRGLNSLAVDFQDTTISIPSATDPRLLHIKLLCVFASSGGGSNPLGTPPILGNIRISGAAATTGFGDLAANPLLDAPFGSTGGPVIGVGSTNLDFNFKITTQHDSSSAVFSEYINSITVKIR